MEENSLSFILANSGIYITILGIFLVIAIGGILWAKNQITKGLSSEFVTQKQHAEKEKEITVDINTKYEDIKNKISENHREWENEIKRLKAETDKTKELLFRIDTKVQLLVDDKIKKD